MPLPAGELDEEQGPVLEARRWTSEMQLVAWEASGNVLAVPVLKAAERAASLAMLSHAESAPQQQAICGPSRLTMK